MHVEHKGHPQGKAYKEGKDERVDKHGRYPCDFTRENMEEEPREPQKNETNREENDDKIIGVWKP